MWWKLWDLAMCQTKMIQSKKFGLPAIWYWRAETCTQFEHKTEHLHKSNAFDMSYSLLFLGKIYVHAWWSGERKPHLIISPGNLHMPVVSHYRQILVFTNFHGALLSWTRGQEIMHPKDDSLKGHKTNSSASQCAKSACCIEQLLSKGQPNINCYCGGHSPLLSFWEALCTSLSCAWAITKCILK